MRLFFARAIAAALSISAALAVAEPAPSQAAALLPPSETCLYARTVGDKRDEVEQRLRLVKDKGWYELSVRSAEQDSLLRLDQASLFASYIEVTSRSKDATIRRVTSVVENRVATAPDEFLVSSFEALPYSLRAFPWASGAKAKLAFLGSGGSGMGNFRFDLGVTGRETLQVGGRSVECWKAQLSLGGIFGSFVGKSYLWYSIEYPHYLVRSEGASGPPGTPSTVLALKSYSRD